MEYCDCTKYMERIASALNVLYSTLLGTEQGRTTSMTDSGESISQTPSIEGNGSAGFSNVIMFMLLFAFVFSLIMRLIRQGQVERREDNRNQEGKNVKKQNSFKS